MRRNAPRRNGIEWTGGERHSNGKAKYGEAWKRKCGERTSMETEKTGVAESGSGKAT